MLEVPESTFVVNQDEILYRVSMDRVNLVVWRDDEAEDLREERTEKDNNLDGESTQQQTDTKTKQIMERSVQLYTVEMIFLPINWRNDTYYSVSWYGYKAVVDSKKPAWPALMQLINMYLKEEEKEIDNSD